MSLRRLADATGAVRIANPETGTGTALSVEEYLDAIDRRLGVRLDFPNPYPRERGVLTSRVWSVFDRWARPHA